MTVNHLHLIFLLIALSFIPAQSAAASPASAEEVCDVCHGTFNDVEFTRLFPCGKLGKHHKLHGSCLSISFQGVGTPCRICMRTTASDVDEMCKLAWDKRLGKAARTVTQSSAIKCERQMELIQVVRQLQLPLDEKSRENYNKVRELHHEAVTKWTHSRQTRDDLSEERRRVMLSQTGVGEA